MSVIKLLNLSILQSSGLRLKRAPLSEPRMPSKWLQQSRIASVRRKLAEGDCAALSDFIQENPGYAVYVVAALIDEDDVISFNAEWCLNMLARSDNQTLKEVLRPSLIAFLKSPWMERQCDRGDERAIELARELRGIQDFITS